MRTFPSAKPASRPSKNFASPTGSLVEIFASRPRKRSKSAGFFSARSIPGELTSSVYPAGPGIRSSTSRITLNCWLTSWQSEWLIFGYGSLAASSPPKCPAASLIPAAGFGTRSMYTLRNRCLPIFHSTSTISRPSERATRSAASRILSKSKQRLPDRSRSAMHSNRPNKKVGLRPLLRATRFRAKSKYIPAARQKQDKGPLTPSARNSNPTLTRTARKTPDRIGGFSQSSGLCRSRHLLLRLRGGFRGGRIGRRRLCGGRIGRRRLCGGRLGLRPCARLDWVRLVVEAHDFLRHVDLLRKIDDRRILRRIIQEEDVAVLPRITVQHIVHFAA